MKIFAYHYCKRVISFCDEGDSFYPKKATNGSFSVDT